MTMFFPGWEISLVSSMVKPKMPYCSPLFSMIIQGSIFPARVLSAEKSKLAQRIGKSASLTKVDKNSERGASSIYP